MARRYSYAQTGQDVLIDYLLRKRRQIPPRGEYKGVYVDIGCCFPVQSSNTFFFYDKGWRGVCIDANPAAQEEFVRLRPEDTFVSVAIGDEEGEGTFYTFTNPQLNTFNPARKRSLARAFVAEVAVKIRPLSAILDDALPANTHIDFMSIDVEGHEIPVLSSLDFSRYRPVAIVLEVIAPIASIFNNSCTEYLSKVGYELVSHTGHDAVFFDRNAPARFE